MASPRDIDLEGRIALVTGGARGIGLAICERLLDAGATVAIAARTPSELESARRDCGGGARVSVHQYDVAVASQATALVREVTERFGRLDVLVCSHGCYPGTRSLLDITLEEYEQTVRVNVRGAFVCAQEAARAMLADRTGGRIILISSINASKAAIHGPMRALALELEPHGITVNAIAPGWVPSPISAAELDHLSDNAVNPLRRVSAPHDIARAALWLADPANNYVTGSVVTVDDGQTAMLPLPWSSEPIIAVVA